MINRLRRWLLAAAAGLGSGVGRALPSTRWQTKLLAVPEPLLQMLAHADGRWLGIGQSGRLWLIGGDAEPRTLADGIDPLGPLATGHGRMAARRADGRLWLDGAASDIRIAPRAGLLVLPQAVIAVEDGGLNARAVRLEPDAAGRWRVAARGDDPVLPDARPLLVDIDGRGDDGHVLLLAGPDAQRYTHAVLGDGIEATRVLWLDRHRLQPLRTLDLPAPQVLEDIAPRVWHGGGGAGLISMLSDAQGARLVLIEADAAHADRLVIAAQGEPIGTRHRWMAASTDGRRLVAVHMPHLSGLLIVYQRQGGALVGHTLAGGVSNHAIGTRELDVSAWRDGWFLVPDAATPRLRVFDVDAGQELAAIVLPGRLRQISVNPSTRDVALLTTNGSAHLLQPARAGQGK